MWIILHITNNVDPVECKYTYVVTYDIIYIVTTITALIGGLITILQIVVPRAVKLMRHIWFKRCHRTTVQVISSEAPR